MFDTINELLTRHSPSALLSQVDEWTILNLWFLLEFSRIPAAKTLKNLYRLQTGEENQNTKNKNRKLRNWWLRTKLTTGRFATGRFSPCTWKISPVGKDIVVFVMIERIFTSSLSTNALYDFSCHQRASVHNKQKNTWLLVDMEFLFLFFFFVSRMNCDSFTGIKWSCIAARFKNIHWLNLHCSRVSSSLKSCRAYLRKRRHKFSQPWKVAGYAIAFPDILFATNFAR